MVGYRSVIVVLAYVISLSTVISRNSGSSNGVIPDRREPYRRVPLGRVHLDERRLDEVQ